MKKGPQQDKRGNGFLAPEVAEVLERITDAFFVIETTGNVLYVNKEAEKIFRKDREFLLGKNLQDVFPQAVGTQFDTEAQKALATLKPSHFEAYFTPLSIWAEVHMYPSKNGMSVYFQNITERKETEQQLIFQSTILQNIREGVVVVNMKGKIIYWNKGAERIFGYTEREALGQSPEFLYIDPKKEHSLHHVEEIIKGKTFIGNLQRKTKKGDLIWVEIFTSVLKDPIGRLIGTMGISRDITEIKKANEHIQYLASLVNDVSDSIISTDVNRDIVSWNKAAEKLYGWTEKEVLGKQASKILALPIDIPRKETLYSHVFRKGEWRGEIMHKKKDGAPVPVMARVSRILDSKGNTQGLVSINTDITEQKELEARRNDFIAMASHELKTPLTSFRIYTQLFSRALQQTNPTVNTYVQKMEHDLDRLQRLIADLLDISKIQQGKYPMRFNTFDILDLIKEYVAFMQLSDSHHTFIFKSKEHIAVWGDLEKIAQVIINLLTNAAKYSPEKTPITIDVQEIKNMVRVAVADKGIGVAKKYQERIFEQFFRVTEKEELQTYEGLGIGLYICREIIRAHGGTMWVESEEGKGSSFFFTLPIAKGE